MDLKDLEKEIGDLDTTRLRKPGKRVDLNVKNASVKVLISKLLAVAFIIAIAIFAIYTILNAKSANVDFKVAAVLAVIYLVLGAYVSFKLWNIDFMGWVALFFTSIAGIILPVISAINHGIMIGTIPIVVMSLASLIGLWWIKDLYRVKKFGDIFTPKQ